MNIVGSNALVMFPEIDTDEWNEMFDTNVVGTLSRSAAYVSDWGIRCNVIHLASSRPI